MGSQRCNVSDSDIVNAFFRRDPDAPDLLKTAYGGFLFSLANGILGDVRDSEECVNDALLKVWDSIPPDRPDSLIAYLAVLIRHLSIDRYKKSKRQKRIPSAMTDSLDDFAEILTDDTVEDETERIRIRESIDAYLRNTSVRKRMIFVSRYYLGKTVSETASELDLSPATIKKEIAEIKSGLLARLRESGLEP